MAPTFSAFTLLISKGLNIRWTLGYPIIYLSSFSKWVTKWYREVIQVRKDMDGFLGFLCFLKHHGLLPAFEATSNSNWKHGLSVLWAPLAHSQIETPLPVLTLSLAKSPHVVSPGACADGRHTHTRHQPLSYWTSLTKHMFTGRINTNSK